MNELVRETFEWIGVKGIKARGRTVFVRTMPIERITAGGIYLPPKLACFLGDMPHIRIVRGLVLASGPLCEVQEGDRVQFQRLHFARWQGIGEDQFVGWIHEEQLLGKEN